MEVRFNLVQIDGQKIINISQFEDSIFNILAHYTDEHDEATVGTDWFSLSKTPTLSEILAIERKLVNLGLIIEA